MRQTAYKGISNFFKGVPYLGGVCKFWFIPIDEVDSIPVINPATQYLAAEPVLKAGCVWRGPVPVPDAQLGITETQEYFNGAPFWKTKLQGEPPGDVPQQRVNAGNLAYGQYLCVAKIRAGGFYLLLGTLESPMDFDQEFSTGNGNGPANAKRKIGFSTECIDQALVIPHFNGEDSGYSFPCDGSTESPGNLSELVYFDNVDSLSISWTALRQQRYGVFPEVETYIKDDTNAYYKSATQPYVDAPPPGFTVLHFDFGGPSTGFVLIK